MNLFELFVKIGVDDQASDKISSLSSKLGNGLKTAAKIGATAITAVTTATTAMSAALIKGVSQTAEYGDNIDKMSQKMGMSAEAYQEWDAVMQHSGTSIESLQSGMKTLANAVESGNDAFDRLGISQEEIAKMSNEELFSATITALQNVDNETERTYLAGQLLGRGATELGALLNTSAEDTQAMKDRVHELGGVMSDEAVKAAAKFQDNLQDMKTAISGVGRGITSDFLPGINDLMDGITRLITGEDYADEMILSGIGYIIDAVENTINKVTEISTTIVPAIVDTIFSFLPMLTELGTNLIVQLLTGISSALPGLANSAVLILEQLVTSVVDNLPLLLDAAAETVMTLANGIAESLPELIPTIVDVVIKIVETLIDNVDMLVDAAIEIIIALAEGLINALPKLIEKTPEIITKLVEALVTNAPKLLEAALNLIVTLANGLITSIPELIKAIPQIVTAIVNGFGTYMSKIKDIGKNIVKGVWEGISAMASWIKDKVTNFFSGIVSGVKDFLGIHSPSRVFAGIGENMALGLGEGWEDEFGSIKKRIENGMDFGVANIDVGASMLGRNSSELNSAFSNFAANLEQNATIVVQSVLDGKVIGETAYQYSKNRQRAYGVT